MVVVLMALLSSIVRMLMIPHKIRIDAASVCQLKCPACPTGIGTLGATVVGVGVLTLRRLRRILEGADWVKSIELSNWGEVFLNKQLAEILWYTEAQGIRISMSNGVNLNDATDAQLEAVVKHRVRHIACSIDGATQESYAQYRRGGNFDAVIRNIRRIVEFKRAYHSRYPELTWQFVVFGHNEYELPKARLLAQELGMEFQVKLSWDEAISPIVDVDFVKAETGLEYASRTEFSRETGRHYSRSPCLQLWNEPQINFDGAVLGCCVNTWSSFGDASERDLLEVLRGPDISFTRQMLMGDVPPRDDTPCMRCDRFRYIQRTSDFITPQEIASHAARLVET